MSICLLKEEWSPPTGMIVPKAHRRLKRPMEISVYVRGNFVTCQKNFTAAHIDLKPGLTGGEDRNKVKACILVEQLPGYAAFPDQSSTTKRLHGCSQQVRCGGTLGPLPNAMTGSGMAGQSMRWAANRVGPHFKAQHFADFRIIHSLSITCKNSIRPKNSHVFNHPVTSTSYSAFRGKR